jgi:DNA-binding response OmpR family regulator
MRDLWLMTSNMLVAAPDLTMTFDESMTWAIKAGYQMYLPKPVDPHELAVVVASLARTSRVYSSPRVKNVDSFVE